MEKLNDGKAIRLWWLLRCGEIDDSDAISIFDAQGKLVARGNWYHDRILDHGESWGTAQREGRNVRFDLC